jgi:carbon-monoxide dehydrogenase catalytic subunit
MSVTTANGHRTLRLTINEDAQRMIDVARSEGIDTVWDRLAAQEPQCGYCVLGLSCRNCAMGPCRIDPFGEGPQKGVCGADADVIVARNLGRTIAAGSSSHSDHGRDILEVFRATARGETTGYRIADEAKLIRLATELGVISDGRDILRVAEDVADALYEDYGSRKDALALASRAPMPRRQLWDALHIAPRGIDREQVEMLHRTHMGVDNDYVNILLHALRTGLADGWGGSMIATELSDIMFGTPTPVMSEVNLGVLKTDQVNIAMHGHNPLLSDVVVAAASDPELLDLARSYGAKGINVVGLCCTGNEMMMRRGVPIAGNHLMQELIVVTGALEAMVVDYQCIMPSVTDVAKCYHTQVISTSDKANRAYGRGGVSEPQSRPGPHSGRARPDDGWLLGGVDPGSAGRDSEATGGRHCFGRNPRCGGGGGLQQPQDPPGLRPRRADPPSHRERHSGHRDRMRGSGQRKSRSNAARVRGPGRPRATCGV